MYRNFQLSSVFELSDQSDENGDPYGSLDDIPISSQPEFLSSFLCAEFVADDGISGGMYVHAYMELSANSILGNEESAGEYYLSRIHNLASTNYKTSCELCCWINPTLTETGMDPCTYLWMQATISSMASDQPYFPSVNGYALFGNSLYRIEDTRMTVDGGNVSYGNDTVQIRDDADTPYDIRAMWDGNVAHMRDGSICLFDDETRTFDRVGFSQGDLCSTFDGNPFVMEIWDDRSGEQDAVLCGTVNILSNLVPGMYVNPDGDYALNALSVGYSGGSRLSTEFLAGGRADVFLLEKFPDGVKRVVQSDGGVVLLRNGRIVDGGGNPIVAGDGAKDIFFDGGVLYFLSNDWWYAKYSGGSILPLLSGTPDSSEVAGIGNAGQATYVAANDLYRVNYGYRPDMDLSSVPELVAYLSGETGTGISESSSEDGFYVVSRENDVEWIQEYLSRTGTVRNPIRFTHDVQGLSDETLLPSRIMAAGSDDFILYADKRIYEATPKGAATELISSDIWLNDPPGIAFRSGRELAMTLSENDGGGILRIGGDRSKVLNMNVIESSPRDVEFTDMRMFRGYPLAASRNGMYLVRTEGSDPIVYRRSLKTDPPTEGTYAYSFDGNADRLVAFGGNVALSSPDGCNFGRMFEVGDGINAIYPRNQSEFYAGTGSGMFRTSYKYDFENNTHNLTLSEIKDLVDVTYPTQESSVASVVSAHVAAAHGDGTEISVLNRDGMDAEMSNSDIGNGKWQHIEEKSGETVVANDVVYKMEFGDETNGDIAVSCSNFLSSWGKLRFSYVMKKWKSGVVEMMMYIPTTHTYYIGNLEGCPQYQAGMNGYRPNISAMMDPERSYRWSGPETATDFAVSLDRSIYRMDEVLGVEVYGNSLPLGIYKEPNAQIQMSASMYNSMILPSLVTEVPDGGTDGIGKFGFQCFGTDAQAVQITYYDRSLAYSGETFQVQFRASGASGSMSIQEMEIDVDVVGPRKLRKCGFYWPGSQTKVFLGWAFYP